MNSRTIYTVVAVVGVALAAGAAWWYKSGTAPASDAGAARTAGAPAPGASGTAGPAALVTVATAQKQDMPVNVTVNGNVVSLNSVDVKPQVSNVVQKVHVKEGDFV